MSGLSHVVFLILTIIFPPFALLWIICAVSAGNQRKRLEDRRKDEELALLKELVKQSKGVK